MSGTSIPVSALLNTLKADPVCLALLSDPLGSVGLGILSNGVDQAQLILIVHVDFGFAQLKVPGHILITKFDFMLFQRWVITDSL